MTFNAKNLIARQRKETGSAPSPPLTSLVDMMTILIVFLLVNFSVEGEIFTPAQDVRLPLSTSRQRARPTLSVEVSPTGVSVDGTPIVSLEAVLSESELLIAPLEAALRGRLHADPAAEAADGSHATSDSTDARPVLTIQCDREIDFRVLKRVVHTCSRAGGTDFALLVNREES